MRVAAAAACCAVLAAHAADPALLSRDMAIDPQKDLAETRLIEDLVVACPGKTRSRRAAARSPR